MTSHLASENSRSIHAEKFRIRKCVPVDEELSGGFVGQAILKNRGRNDDGPRRNCVSAVEVVKSKVSSALAIAIALLKICESLLVSSAQIMNSNFWLAILRRAKPYEMEDGEGTFSELMGHHGSVERSIMNRQACYSALEDMRVIATQKTPGSKFSFSYQPN